LGVRAARGLYLHSATDLYDYVHWEEYGHSAAPYSDIPSYLLGLAAGKGKPVLLVQNDRPKRNEIQHRIALAEAYASGGANLNLRPNPEINKEYFDFVQRYADFYASRDVQSTANVAVVLSWWSKAVSEAQTRIHPAYWMGQMLPDLHIPFDYIIAEKDLTSEVTARYKALILPDLAVMTDEQLKILRTYVRGGGHVLATNNAGKYDGELQVRAPPGLKVIADRNVTATARFRVGKGRFAYLAGSPERRYIKQNPRDLSKNGALQFPVPPPKEVTEALSWVCDDLPVEVDARSFTAVIPKTQANRILVHLVNYNVYPDGKRLTPDRDIKIGIRIPSRRRVGGVIVISPDFEGEQRITNWRLDGGVLEVSVGELKVYSVVVVRLE